MVQQVKDKNVKRRINVRLHRIETQNHFGDFKNLGDKLFEMRINYGPGYRIYYTYRDDKIVLLLAGGDKSSQAEDIKLAKALIKEG